VPCRPTFFLSVRVLSRFFRQRFLDYLHAAFAEGRLQFQGSLHALAEPQAFAEHLRSTQHVEWVVYAKAPFAGPQQVLDYVGRYTHRVAIANQRLLDIDDDQVSFRYKDYRADNERAQKNHDASRHGIHPSLPPARAPVGFPPHSVLGISRGAGAPSSP
jgi:Putative transposase